MNRDCNGDVFERWGQTWGRCFMDGTLFVFRPPIDRCPNCRRAWQPVSAETSATQWNPDESIDVAAKIDLPYWRERALDE